MGYWSNTRRMGGGLLACLALLALAQAKDNATTPVVAKSKFAKLHIPHLDQRPVIADFSSMQPSPAFAGKMLKVDGFLQRDPKDGTPVSQKTEVYLGYTDKNLYVVCVCFDSEPERFGRGWFAASLSTTTTSSALCSTPFMTTPTACSST